MNKQPDKKSQRGASLVLVVFMMVVLVSFGILALTSASANMRLSTKTRDWRTDYYLLDSQAADIVFLADTEMHAAEMEARSRMDASGGMDAFRRDYLALAKEKLNVLATQDERIKVIELPENDATFLLEISLESELKSEIGQKYLTVQLAVHAPEYIFPTSNLADVRRAQNTSRYAIAMWMQWQQDFDYEYSNTFELWDGLLDGQLTEMQEAMEELEPLGEDDDLRFFDDDAPLEGYIDDTEEEEYVEEDE